MFVSALECTDLCNLVRSNQSNFCGEKPRDNRRAYYPALIFPKRISGAAVKEDLRRS